MHLQAIKKFTGLHRDHSETDIEANWEEAMGLVGEGGCSGAVYLVMD